MNLCGILLCGDDTHEKELRIRDYMQQDMEVVRTYQTSKNGN